MTQADAYLLGNYSAMLGYGGSASLFREKMQLLMIVNR
jgi:hypothetical protein